MKLSMHFRSGAVLLALASLMVLAPSALAQKGENPPGGEDDPIFPGGNMGNNPPVPEPFTMAPPI